MGFTRARLARPQLSFSIERPEVPEQVRSRIPQRRRQRPWRLYVIGALITVAVASIVTMALRRRLGGAEEEIAADTEASEQPTMGAVPTAPDAVTADPVTDGAAASETATAETATEEPAAAEVQRFSA